MIKETTKLNRAFKKELKETAEGMKKGLAKEIKRIIDGMIGEENKEPKSELIRNPLKGDEYQDYYDGYNQALKDVKKAILKLVI